MEGKMGCKEFRGEGRVNEVSFGTAIKGNLKAESKSLLRE